MKPYQQFNQRMNELYRQSANRRPQLEQKKVQVQRKGEIPLVLKELKGYPCITEPAEQGLRYSKDPYRIQMQKCLVNREKTILQRQKNEERFYRKSQSRNTPNPIKPKKAKTPKESPKTKARTLSSDHDNLPQILSKQSNYLSKLKIGIASQALSELALIEAKSKADQVQRTKKHKQLMKGLKGAKYFYSMSRSFSIPAEFSQD